MKKLKMAFIALAATLISMPFIQSCDVFDDDAPDYDKMGIATIKAVTPDDEENSEFFFLLDDGTKIYPSDASNVGSKYEWKDGQRAFVFVKLLDEPVSGYDLNAKVILIENILTKPVIPLVEEDADSIGDDKINVNYMWFGGGYLNIEFQFMGTRNPEKLHMVNLAKNLFEPQPDEEGYVTLEFRHNEHGDYQREALTGLVSFKPPFTDDASIKGIKLRVNTIYEGVKYAKIDFSQQTGKTISGSLPAVR